MTTYTIQGSRITGLLARRLDEARMTALNSLPGVVVYPKYESVFYVEAFEKGSREPIPGERMNEALRGLVEITTKEMAEEGADGFTTPRELP